MRLRLMLVPLAALGLMSASGAAAQEAAAIYDVTVARVGQFADADRTRMTLAVVTRHVDGDTFEVYLENPPPGPASSERVRLLGIDTPERGEPWAAEAQEYVERRVGADPVYLAFDFRRRDRFDRLLAYVYLSDGTLLNAALMSEGLARIYRGDDSIHFFAQFERLEADARRQRSGVWTDHAGGILIVTISNAGSNEHVLLRNDSAAAVDLSGWRIEDDDGNVLEIRDDGDLTLAPDETLAICSGAGCAGAPERSLRLSERNIWGNDGDRAFLYDADDHQVNSFAYEKTVSVVPGGTASVASTASGATGHQPATVRPCRPHPLYSTPTSAMTSMMLTRWR